LVGDAEEGPEGVDAAQRIDHALIQEIAPGTDQQGAGEDVGEEVPGVAQRLPDAPRKSCKMKRPTRVPASIVVRMKSASNMIAK